MHFKIFLACLSPTFTRNLTPYIKLAPYILLERQKYFYCIFNVSWISYKLEDTKQIPVLEVSFAILLIILANKKLDWAIFD